MFWDIYYKIMAQRNNIPMMELGIKTVVKKTFMLEKNVKISLKPQREAQ